MGTPGFQGLKIPITTKNPMVGIVTRCSIIYWSKRLSQRIDVLDAFEKDKKAIFLRIPTIGHHITVGLTGCFHASAEYFQP